MEVRLRNLAKFNVVRDGNNRCMYIAKTAERLTPEEIEDIDRNVHGPAVKKTLAEKEQKQVEFFFVLEAHVHAHAFRTFPEALFYVVFDGKDVDANIIPDAFVSMTQLSLWDVDCVSVCYIDEHYRSSMKDSKHAKQHSHMMWKKTGRPS